MAKTTSWKSLEHKHGPATKVPEQIEQLLGPPSVHRAATWLELRDALAGDGAWFSAGAPAAQLLLGRLKKAASPEILLLLVADIVGADHVRAWFAPVAEELEDAAPAVAAAMEAKKEILAALRAKAPALRVSAALLLAVLVGLRDEAIPLLTKQAEGDDDEAARASAILALGRLSEGHAATTKLLGALAGKGAGLVRGAAEVALLRAEPARPLASAADRLVDWLGTSSETELPWFGALPHIRRLSDAQPASVAALARHRGPAAVAQVLPILVRGAAAEDDLLPIQSTKALLAVGDFPTDPGLILLPKELSDAQRKAASGLAEIQALPSGGYGVAPSGGVRRRWLGLAAPGPLEGEVAGKPVWRAILEAAAAGGKRPFPPSVDPLLTGAQRWEALAELAAGSYGRTLFLDDASVARELAALPEEGDVTLRAERLADDLAPRFARMHAWGRPGIGQAASTLLLTPLLRAKKPLKEAWASLAAVDGSEGARAVLKAFPPAVRARLIRAFAESAPDDGALASSLQAVLGLVDLAPSPEILAIVERRIPSIKVFMAANQVRQQLAKVRAVQGS